MGSRAAVVEFRGADVSSAAHPAERFLRNFRAVDAELRRSAVPAALLVDWSGAVLAQQVVNLLVVDFDERDGDFELLDGSAVKLGCEPLEKQIDAHANHSGCRLLVQSHREGFTRAALTVSQQ